MSKENSIDREDLGVGLEGDLGALALGGADGLQRRYRLAAPVALLPDLAVALDLERQPLGERVHHRDADAVEAARDLVGLLVELAAGVEARHHDLGRGAPLAGVHVHRNAAAVVATVTLPSAWIVTLISLQKPARASSMELSTTS